MSIASRAAGAALATLPALVCTGAAAHTGHDTAGLLSGLVHPLGPDHLLAMVAVGLWSALQGRPAWRLAGPLAFLAALLAGAVVGRMLPLPAHLESAIAASVMLLGVLLLVPQVLPRAAALALIAAAASLHGLAHGAESSADFTAYAAGFMIASAALHAIGLAAGMPLARMHAAVRHAVALAFTFAGLALLGAA